MRHIYRPLPDKLTIKKSPIEGLGLFSVTDIVEGTVLGQTHYNLEGDLIRTPLGGFINHSDNFNAEILKNDKGYYIEIITDIASGDEILVNYMMTSCCISDGKNELSFE